MLLLRKLLKGVLMNWQYFQTHNEAPTKAFEAFCNQLFENYCKRKFLNELKYFTVVNGSGGDGGVEAYAKLNNGEFIGLQAKWFKETLKNTQFKNIKNSINNALKVRPTIKEYIVCVPRDFTSTKNTKNNKNAKNTEDANWKKLLKEAKNSYPNLKIILWNESELLNQLQKTESEDIRRYWFEKSELNFETLKYSFEKQKESWLKIKYLPDLNVNGEINATINKFIGSSYTKENLKKQINSNFLIYQELLDILNKAQKFYKITDELKAIFKNIELETKNNIEILKQYQMFLKNEVQNKEIKFLKFINFENLLEEFVKKNSKSSAFYYDFKNIIKQIENINCYRIKKEIDFIEKNLIIFQGAPGTGKTHGIASVVDNLLINKNAIPILIQAKSVSKNDSWKDILIKVLGLSQDWSEKEILSALEALSFRCEIEHLKNEDDKKEHILPKVLICIDGLDELRPFDFWIEKLKETTVISNSFPRIKFCATSRPCVFFDLKQKDDLIEKSIFINEKGDADVSKLYDKYLNYYNIKVKNSNWLKWSLNTPLNLKLFCEINQNKTLDKVDRKSITISKLIAEKIKTIDSEFRNKCDNYEKEDNIVHNAISAMSDYFFENNFIKKVELIKLLKEKDELSFIEQKDIRSLLQTLEHNGFLQTFVIQAKNETDSKQVFFEKGIQPFFDYFLSLKLLNKYQNFLEDTFSNFNIEPYSNMLQMYSLILLEEKNILISEIPYFKKRINLEILENLDFFALTNNDPKIVEKFKNYILSIMDRNANSLINVLKNVILPISKIENHPLGPIMLHKYLSKFKKPAQRDLVWSIQNYLFSEKDEKWNCSQTLHLENYELTKEDNWKGLPLVYAWLLTNVDEEKRLNYRRNLLKWAISNPKGYYELFNFTYLATNDPQMKSELMNVAMGLIYSIPSNREILNLFSEFIFKHIFNKSKIKTINNVAIRQFARCIIEKSYKTKLITKDMLKASIPPFDYDLNHNLPLFKDAMQGGNEYKSISYDLGRYVLIDSIWNLFFDKDYSSSYYEDFEHEYYPYFKIEEIDEILKKYPNLNLKDKKTLIEIKKRKIEQEEKINKMFGIPRKTFNFSCQEEGKKDEILEIPKDNNETSPKDFYEGYNKKAIEFLKKQAQILGVENIHCNQYVLAAAWQYLLDMGWSEELFGKNLDSAIKRLCRPASHGSKSKIMTICEKYIWCFKYEIYGYLFDRLGIHNNSYFDTRNFPMDDYSLIISNFINSIQELYIEEENEEEAHSRWLLEENLHPLIKGINSNSKKDIKNYIDKTPDPDFSKWIDIKQEQQLNLYCSNLVVEKNIGVRSLLWLSSGIIKASDFEIFLKDLKNKKADITKKLNNPCEIYSKTHTSCYLTPKEICLFSWKKEIANKIYTATIHNNKIQKYEITKAVEECVSNYGDYDIFYYLPSKYVRKLLNITDGDGTKYYNAKKNLKARYYKAGSNFDEHQYVLCADKKQLLEKLDKKNEKMFWIARVLKEPSSASFELHDDFYYKKDKVWLIWQENGEWKDFCFIEESFKKTK